MPLAAVTSEISPYSCGLNSTHLADDLQEFSHQEQSSITQSAFLAVCMPLANRSNSVPLSPPRGYIPDTSLTLCSGHMVYTFWHVELFTGGRYALEGDLCYG